MKKPERWETMYLLALSNRTVYSATDISMQIKLLITLTNTIIAQNTLLKTETKGKLLQAKKENSDITDKRQHCPGR